VADRVLGQVGELADKRSLVLVFSDLLDTEPDGGPAQIRGGARGAAPALARGTMADRLANLAARGHDVVLFHILHPDEVELPFEDLMFFEGMEPGDSRSLLAEAADLREAFREESRAFRERWRLHCLEAGVEYRFATTAEAPADVLRAFLGARRRARR
jgi:hypothetical protein